MTRTVTFAVTQFACVDDAAANGDRAEALVRKAAGQGANVILLQELFETPYFCKTERPEYLSLSAPFEGNRLVARFASLAKELGVVLPVSFFEKAGHTYFNSLAMDPQGHNAGMASSVTGSAGTAIAAVAGGLVARAFDGSIFPLAAGFAVCSLIAGVIVLSVEGISGLFGRNRRA